MTSTGKRTKGKNALWTSVRPRWIAESLSLPLLVVEDALKFVKGNLGTLPTGKPGTRWFKEREATARAVRSTLRTNSSAIEGLDALYLLCTTKSSSKRKKSTQKKRKRSS